MQHVAPPPANKERRLAFEGESTNEKRSLHGRVVAFNRKNLCVL